jgi:hypothetical protein
VKTKLLAGLAMAGLIAGCSTNVKLLEMRRDQLVTIETSAKGTRDLAAQGAYDPNRYDLYLMLNATVFDQLLAGFDGTKVTIDGKRPIDITLGSIRMAFRPGYPDVTVNAKARDRKSGAVAELAIDIRLLVEGDPAKPDTLYLRPVATRIVPQLKWGILDLAKWRFAQRLLTLEATRVTEKVPRISIPVQNRFVIGGKASSQQTRIDTGDGYILGNVAYPSTEREAGIAVRHILFLKNGVHVFADVEGL